MLILLIILYLFDFIVVFIVFGRVNYWLCFLGCQPWFLFYHVPLVIPVQTGI